MIFTEHVDFWSRIRFAAEWHRLTGDLAVYKAIAEEATQGSAPYRVYPEAVKTAQIALVDEETK